MYRLAWLWLAFAPVRLLGQAQVGNCSIFPARNIWNVPIDKLPVHPNSALYISTEGPLVSLHPDFGPTAAIPFSVVPATQPKVPIRFTDGQSDPGPYPIPPKASVEPGSDAHLIVLDQDECKLYEVYNAKPNGDGTWTGGTGAIFDLRLNALRPDGWTSADAAGLPIFAGLVRYEEVAAGQIRHALRLTVPKTNNSYVWPGRHYASRLNGDQYPPMGQRFRLKASYDTSGFDPTVRVILQALKTYGMMLADNGSAWYITGAPDSRWNDEILGQLKRVTGADLEAVDVSSLQAAPHSALAIDPNASNRVNVAFSATPVFDLAAAPAQSMTLTGDVTASTIANPGDGQTVSFLICQDATGGHSFTWPANVQGGMLVGMTAGKCSAQTFVSDGANLYATTPGVANM
jgi:hypothetical protein